jgi:hypothetical protein
MPKRKVVANEEGTPAAKRPRGHSPNPSASDSDRGGDDDDTPAPLSGPVDWGMLRSYWMMQYILMTVHVDDKNDADVHRAWRTLLEVYEGMGPLARGWSAPRPLRDALEEDWMVREYAGHWFKWTGLRPEDVMERTFIRLVVGHACEGTRGDNLNFVFPELFSDFALETAPSRIAGAGLGLFVAGGGFVLPQEGIPYARGGVRPRRPDDSDVYAITTPEKGEVVPVGGHPAPGVRRFLLLAGKLWGWWKRLAFAGWGVC